MDAFKTIIDTIDKENSKIDFDVAFKMLEEEFDIYEYVTQTVDRLGYRPYHNWICTDSGVGIDVWEFDGEVVCISYKPYRKSDTTYYWVDGDKRKTVRDYLMSLREEEDEEQFNLVNQMGNLLECAKSIEHKQFEKLYTICEENDIE